MDDIDYNPNKGLACLVFASDIKPPKKECDKSKESVPSIKMRKMPPSSPLQPPTKTSSRGPKKK